MNKRVSYDDIELEQYTSKPDKRDKFSMAIPPPNVTGFLHLGHALNNTLQDILIRRKRIQGFNTIWVPGTDHAGIAAQTKVEKNLLDTEGKLKDDIGREKFLDYVYDWSKQYKTRIINQLKSIGISCDWSKEAFTQYQLNLIAEATFCKSIEYSTKMNPEKTIKYNNIYAILDDQINLTRYKNTLNEKIKNIENRINTTNNKIDKIKSKEKMSNKDIKNIQKLNKAIDQDNGMLKQYTMEC